MVEICKSPTRMITKADYPAVYSLVRAFHDEYLKDYGLSCNADSVFEALKVNEVNTMVLEMDNKIVGVLGGALVKYLGNGEIMYNELIWYVLPGFRQHGYKLLTSMELMLKYFGVHGIVMIALNNDIGKRLAPIYKRRGYELIETHYLKRF